jgi:hypothetical protein
MMRPQLFDPLWAVLVILAALAVMAPAVRSRPIPVTQDWLHTNENCFSLVPYPLRPRRPRV